MRNLWIAIGLSLVGGCQDSKHQFVTLPATLEVDNQGSGSVHGRAEDWDGNVVQDFSVQPGASATVTVFSVYRVKLHVWRDSDNALLFDDFWDVGELQTSEPKVVTVYP